MDQDPRLEEIKYLDAYKSSEKVLKVFGALGKTDSVTLVPASEYLKAEASLLAQFVHGQVAIMPDGKPLFGITISIPEGKGKEHVKNVVNPMVTEGFTLLELLDTAFPGGYYTFEDESGVPASAISVATLRQIKGASENVTKKYTLGLNNFLANAVARPFVAILNKKISFIQNVDDIGNIVNIIMREQPNRREP